MSSGQAPRTPAHFPRMKIRGKRRRVRAFERLVAVDARIQSAIDQVLELITDAFGIPRIDTRDIFAPSLSDVRNAAKTPRGGTDDGAPVVPNGH